VWSVLETVIGCGAPEERLEADSNEGQASIYRRKRRENLVSFGQVLFLEHAISIIFAFSSLPSLSWTDKIITFPRTISLQPFLKVER
jgi:hypothetical protein